MKKIKLTSNLLSIFLGVITLTSCDPGLDYKKVVINQSTKKVTLLLDKNYNGYKMDTILINEGSYYVVEAATVIDGPGRYSNCNSGIPLSYINPLDSSKVNITNSPNWIYQDSKKGRGRIVNCSYIIKDESFTK